MSTVQYLNKFLTSFLLLSLSALSRSLILILNLVMLCFRFLDCRSHLALPCLSICLETLLPPRELSPQSFRFRELTRALRQPTHRIPNVGYSVARKGQTIDSTITLELFFLGVDIRKYPSQCRCREFIVVE
ncbi:hypothetical protein F5888DRAFT_1693389 [Russula emetica]|nr:hypothetical protein F5888DRAFT_1693389 [Russula emetica]